jgi:glycosyltransferase involved in cell wall biosynthesis
VAGTTEYNFVREVDYCSGACLAIKKEIFKSCNGFDERYYPAYFEDTDLCFTVRKLGYKVLYQPKAEIVHFEGITAGRDESAGVKSFQRINKPKFYEKWQPVLQEKHWPPDPDLAWRARRHGKKPEVLIMDHHMPTYDKDSGSFRMWNIIKLFLELGWNVTFYPDNLVPLEPYTSQLQQIGVEVIYGSTTFKNFLSQRRLQFDVVLLARPDFSFPKVDLVRQLLPRTKIIYDTVDLHFLREQRRAEIEGSREARLASERYKAMELYLVKTSDVTFVVTEDERKHLLNLDPNLNVAIIPNIHPLPERKPPAFENRSGIMFVGSYLHPPNVDGVKWFVAEIWPKIRQKIPDIVFYVIGSNVPKDILRLEKEPGVKVIGWVPNVEPWFDRCRVFVSPLRYGAGMKGKIGHAMSYGLPVVTTSVGAEGMGLKDRENALIRDNPEEFTQAVVELYESRNLWEKIEENALEHIHINYTPKVIRERLSLILRDLARPTRNLSSDYH